MICCKPMSTLLASAGEAFRHRQQRDPFDCRSGQAAASILRLHDLFDNGNDSDPERTIVRSGWEDIRITGTVVAATGTTLAIQKGTEKYEFAIDPATIKGSAELKVGSTVTVRYVMSATKVEQSAAGPNPASGP